MLIHVSKYVGLGHLNFTTFYKFQLSHDYMYSVHSPFCWVVEPPTQFFKREHLTEPRFLEGCCWERWGDLFEEGGCNFFINKLNSEIFNNKKIYEQKCFSLLQLRYQTGKLKVRI